LRANAAHRREAGRGTRLWTRYKLPGDGSQTGVRVAAYLKHRARDKLALASDTYAQHRPYPHAHLA
jgi:hypothetical protein